METNALRIHVNPPDGSLHIDIRHTLSDPTLLESLRALLGSAQEVLLCMAFVSDAGVHLLMPELRQLGSSCRLLCTTAFGTTTDSALRRFTSLSCQLRVLNPAHGTFHPKLILTRTTDSCASAMIGSNNLTAGLIGNTEIATIITGPVEDPKLEEAWSLGESLWCLGEPWNPGDRHKATYREQFSSLLYDQIKQTVSVEPVFSYLSRKRRFQVTDLTKDGLWIDLLDSPTIPRQYIPAYILQIAWDHVQTTGEVTNSYLKNRLRIGRSGAVCAILARLPNVHAGVKPVTKLNWREKYVIPANLADHLKSVIVQQLTQYYMQDFQVSAEAAQRVMTSLDTHEWPQAIKVKASFVAVLERGDYRQINEFLSPDNCIHLVGLLSELRKAPQSEQIVELIERIEASAEVSRAGGRQGDQGRPRKARGRL